MAQLSDGQRAFYREHGFLVIEHAVDAALLARMKEDFAAWVDESRRHAAAWGDTLDGRGGRNSLLAESGTEPLRGADRARSAHRTHAIDRLRARAAANADHGVVLRPAGAPRLADARALTPPLRCCFAEPKGCPTPSAHPLGFKAWRSWFYRLWSAGVFDGRPFCLPGTSSTIRRRHLSTRRSPSGSHGSRLGSSSSRNPCCSFC